MRRARLDVLAVLAVDAGIPPWQARDHLTIEEADAIISLLTKRPKANHRH